MSIALGIDIGTTKAAAVLFDAKERRLLDSASLDTKADLPSPVGFHEQDPERIFSTIDALLDSVDPKIKAEVASIGVTGQMHGVVLASGDKLSRLVTWKDRRCSADGSLSNFKKLPGCRSLKDGFGFSTLAWLASKGELSAWRSACTIHDLLVARLCSLARPLIDPADAASWGLFDIYSNSWDVKAIAALGVSAAILPELVASGSAAGRLSTSYAGRWGLPQGIPVSVATGDNQASILATAKDFESEVYLTVGTGAQLSIAVKAADAKVNAGSQAMELRPFFDGRLLAVAAPLCGGQAFAWLVKGLRRSLQDLGVEAPAEAALYKRLDVLAMDSFESPLDFKTNFLGERHAPELKGGISGFSMENATLGNIASSLAGGIFENMRSMMPSWVFEGRESLVASGNAMRRLEIMKAKATSVFKLPLVIPDSKEEAACGAALLSSRLVD